ncbi:MAG TPA: GntR family transcriptional regulator [Bacilli bacterium]
MKINKTSPVPLYHQLRSELERLIQEEKMKPGDAFPSELELCDMYNVSRTTVRQAIREMFADGLIYRDHPRGRPLVAATKVRQKLMRLEGFFSVDMLSSGLSPTTQVLSVELVAKTSASLELGLPANEKVYRLLRLHGNNGEPLVIQNVYLPRKIFQRFKNEDLSKSLFQYIETTYQHRIVRAVQTISTRQPDAKERELLHITPHTSVFQVNRTSYADDGTAVEYFVCILRGDRYDFVMELNAADA